MATISVPLSAEQEHLLDGLVQDGVGANRADVMRRALKNFAEKEAIRVVLDAEREPVIRGDIRSLLKKI
jgi:Arc/MetJ-type ribon-helix-helix transcriptional regulator